MALTHPHDPERTDLPDGRPQRVLAIRSDGLRDRVGAAVTGAGIHAEVVSAASFLSAMGEVRDNPPDVIIGPVSAMTGMVASTGRALRKLAPRTRLVAVASEEERGEAATAIASGFDDCVFEPADASNLLSAMRLQRPEPRDEKAMARQLEHATEQAAAQGRSARSQMLADPAASAGQQHAPAPSDEIGDTDLVDAILRADRTLPGLALRLLRRQSGLASVSLSEKPEQVPPDHVRINLPTQATTSGVLHAPPPVTEQQLRPWAGWLSRWLMLGNRMQDLHTLAMTDELTGAWNRRYFRRFLDRLLSRAAEGRQQVTLLLFDIDDFKSYNDNYGHPAGDEILRETAKLIQSLVREHDVVARIGGDEFAVVFWDKGEPRQPGSQHPDKVINIARRFQHAICEHRYPKLGNEATGRLTVSGGLASFPWDGRTPDELIARADAMAIASKRQGKNVICFGPGVVTKST
ncbi:MAG: diguanylate cyclase [Planctomycetota bacterium]